MNILEERKLQVYRKGAEPFQLDCNKQSAAGSVSQRACVFCGSRVVLYPIADALHLVHGPLGCAAYTWDIRGALSSGPQLHRLSFSTDLREMDVIQGGEKKLAKALCQLIDLHRPKAAFVYSTCIVGVIGDDVEAVCRQVSALKGIPVLPVHSEGFTRHQARRLSRRLRSAAAARGHGFHRGHRPGQRQYPGRFQHRRRSVDHPRLLRKDGRAGGRHHHRRWPRGRHPPRARRGAQPGAVLRLHDAPGQADAGEARHPLQAGLVFRHRRHGPGALRYRRVLRGAVSRHRGADRRAGARGAGRRSCRRSRNTGANWRAARPRCTWAARSRRFRWCGRCASWAWIP